jgi:type VI protein secretion system component Hcp
MLDGFLELVHKDGIIAGETMDAKFRGRAIAIREFSVGDTSSKARGEVEHDKAIQMALANPKPTTSTQSKSALPTQSRLNKSTKDSASEDKKKKEKDKENQRLSFRINKEVDSSSADLFLAYCRMRAIYPPDEERDQMLDQFVEATVTLRKMFGTKPKPYLVYKFKGVRLVSYQLSISSGDDPIPDETVQFEFDSYTFQYTTQQKTGEPGVTKESAWHI